MAAAGDLDIQTISGRLRFYRKGENRNPDAAWQGTLNPFPTQIQGAGLTAFTSGEYATLWPPQFATGTHTYPRPSTK